MKQFLIIFIISAFILACFFWEAELLLSDKGLIIDTITFLFVNFILSLIIIAFYRFFSFIKNLKSRDISNEIVVEKSGEISKGIFISFIIFIAVTIPEIIFYFIGGIFFASMTITSPFLLSMIFSSPFLFLNFIFFLFNRGNTRRGLKYGFLFFLIFFVILFGINLYIFIFQNETYVYSKDIEALNRADPRDVGACYKLKSPSLRDSCFSTRAMLKNDISLCNEIKDFNELSYCLYIFSRDQKDISFCNKLADLDRVGCIQDVAANTQNPEYCAVLLGTNYADNCYYRAIEKMTDKSVIAKYCALMKSEMLHQQNCLKLLK